MQASSALQLASPSGFSARIPMLLMGNALVSSLVCGHRHFSPWQIDGDDKNIKALENRDISSVG